MRDSPALAFLDSKIVRLRMAEDGQQLVSLELKTVKTHGRYPSLYGVVQRLSVRIYTA